MKKLRENYFELKKFGLDLFFEEQITDKDQQQNLIPARITEAHRDTYMAVTEFGIGRARLKASIFYNEENYVQFPAVGDFVMLLFNPHGDHLIYRVMNRKTCFTRQSPEKGRGEQVVSANFNWVFIMTSLNHEFSPGRLLRYATMVFQSGGTPVIILTKIDLCENFETQRLEALKAVPGVDVIGISSHTGEGLDQLKPYLRPTDTVVFMGSSGVGKSSLLNVLSGEEIMVVNEIREEDSRGKHTTTHRQLILLKSGTIVIDTPGMREVGFWGDGSEGLSETFSDVEELMLKCRFSDCNHVNEPGCRVKEALLDGILSKKRWKDYQKLQKEAQYAEKKEKEYMILREKRMSR